MRTLDFTGKDVLVTGASSGIGLAVARGFALCGANLTVLAENKEVFRAADTISQDIGAKVTALQCDISDREAVARSFATISHIDVLINNAGIERVTPVDKAGEEVEDDFRMVINVNLLGTIYVTREAIRLMQEGGKIVFTASTWSKTAFAQMSAYCASKHAVLGFARAIAYELGPRGISVNCICPGWVKTDQSLKSVLEISHNVGRPVDDISEELLEKQAIGGMLIPEDMVSGYLFLASDLARDITGQSLHIDRGEVMS